MAKRARARARPRRRTTGVAAGIPERIYAQVSPRSVGGVSLFDAQYQVRQETVGSFYSDPGVTERAVERLQDAGFEVLQVTPVTINIAGTRRTYEQAFKTKIVAEEREVIKERGRKDTATFLDSPDTALPGLLATAGTNMSDVIEGVALEEPRYYMAPSMFAPLKAYWHLRLPGDVSLAANADRAHRAGTTGKGIRVAMADSGWYKHPFFVERGYRAAPVVLAPGATNVATDEVGHGTGESANVFATAPDAELLPVKISLVNTVAAFNTAAGLSPHIITCSWGSHKPSGPLSAADMALAAAIATAVAAGIVVVFSAGNGSAGFPAQHPDVIAAGGVFMHADGTFEASNYASAFTSTIYSGRRVPDVCGLVGMKPKAIYIMLPLEPSDDIDSGNAGGTFPNGDETAANDGWAGFSGTSAAAPQLAGVSALIKQACPALTPAQVKSILMSAGRDVTAGTSNVVPPFGAQSAGPGPDAATGNGLVDAHKSVLLAKLKCLGPITPVTGITPITGPITPVTAITPVTGITPITAPTPITSIGPTPISPPITPVTTIRPVPITPITRVTPPGPGPTPEMPGPVGGPAETEARRQQPARLSSDDVEALTELIKTEDIDYDV